MTRTAHVGPASEPQATTTEGPVPAAPGSPLFNLRAMREAKLAKLYIDLPVPRWGEDGTVPIIVRYKPVDPSKALTRTEKRQRDGDERWLMLANADSLVEACLGIYVLVDGEKYSLTGQRSDSAEGWTRFDPDTAQALGADARRAVDVVRAVYLTDGDVIAAASQLAAFSAKALPQVEKDHQGE